MSRATRMKNPTAWAAAALIGALLADLAEDLVDPANSDKGVKIFNAAANHHGRMIASALCLFATSVLIVPGVVGLARVLRQRGRVLGWVAAALALLGSMGHAALGAIYLVWATLPYSGVRRTDLITVIDNSNDSTWVVVLAPLFIAFPLAFLVLFLAMIRARIAPLLLLVPVVAAPVVNAVAPGTNSAKTGAALGLLIVCAIVVAVQVVTRAPAAEYRRG